MKISTLSSPKSYIKATTPGLVYFFFIFLCICYHTAKAQTPVLVGDFKDAVTSSTYTSSNIINLQTVAGKTFFVARDGEKQSDAELWTTDGTAAGTVMLRDIWPGNNHSTILSISNIPIVHVNGLWYFVASDGVHNYMLWKTDGTPAGTQMVNVFTNGQADTSPVISELCAVGGYLYFKITNGFTWNAAYTGYYTKALCRTNGTAAGTEVIKIYTEQISEDFNSLVSFNNDLYYVMDGELYKCSGNSEPQKVVQNSIVSITNGLTTGPGGIYFRGTTAAAGTELWKYDGTNASLVKDIRAGSNSSSINFDHTKIINGMLFFFANDYTNGGELWKTDGTTAGTNMVKDIVAGAAGVTFSQLETIVYNNELYMRINDGVHGLELWKSDGTEAGTTLVKDTRPGGTSSGSPKYFAEHNGLLYFTADDASGTALWQSNGTEAGTVAVQYFKSLSNLTALGNGNGLVFYGNVLPTPNTNNNELYFTDGTAEGSTMIKNIAGDNPSSLISGSLDITSNEDLRLTYSNNKIYFGAKNNNTYEYSFYTTEGNAATTSTMVKSPNQPTSTIIFPRHSVNVSGIVYYQYYDATNGSELWRSDGTTEGTHMVKDIRPSGSSSPAYLYNLNGVLYFTADDGVNGRELWKSDGTPAGTVMVKDIRSGSQGSTNDNYPPLFYAFNDELFFSAAATGADYELWKTDGTEAGTVMVKNVMAGTAGSYPSGFTTYNNALYFIALTQAASGNSRRLWKTDGTDAGTIAVIDVVALNARGNSVSQLTVAGGNLYFVAVHSSTHSYAVWKTDGTNAGSSPVEQLNINPHPGQDISLYTSYPNQLIAYNNQLYFSAFSPATGYELRKTDGNSVELVKDISSGITSGTANGRYLPSIESNIINLNGVLYFSAYTPETGVELWRSGGTDMTTEMVADLFPGPQSSNPKRLTQANGKLYFVADDGEHGLELFSFDPYSNSIIQPAGNAEEKIIDVSNANTAVVSGTNQVLASVWQAGNKPVNGKVNIKYKKNAQHMLYNGRTLAAKQIDIQPDYDPEQSTATITLYYT